MGVSAIRPPARFRPNRPRSRWLALLGLAALTGCAAASSGDPLAPGTLHVRAGGSIVTYIGAGSSR
jgi:hypothetical protein